MPSIRALTRGFLLCSVAASVLLFTLAARIVVAPAAAAPSASLRVAFTPERLGQSTTVSFAFDLAGEQGQTPPPLTRVQLITPAGLSYLQSTLGLATCSPALIDRLGGAGCPPNSRVGSGSALVAVPIGPGENPETASLEAFMGQPSAGAFTVNFAARGRSPVAALLRLRAEWNPGDATAPGSLDTAVPLVPTVPGGPDVSIVHAAASIGPGNYFYIRHVRHRLVRFRPRGVSLPAICPAGGFPFSATFAFADATSAQASASVPCPSRSAR